MTPESTAAAKPTDDCIVLAALLPRSYDDGWLYADEIRGSLRRLGFDPTTQQVAAWLMRLTREDSPMIERQNRFGDGFQYRVTRFGRTQVGNHFPRLRTW